VLINNQQIENIKINGNVSEKQYIGKDKAKQIALNHAKVLESDTTLLQVEYDYDDGIIIYDIEFNVGNIEYDYEIKAIDGMILESNKESDTFTNNENNITNKKIDKTEALNIALSHAGINKKDTFDISIEHDYENGKEIYEVEFETKEYEYEYYIDAKNGKILYSEKDK